MRRKQQKHSDAAMPVECQDALWIIEGDPINIDAKTFKHISTCRMCSEARVLWLAQEKFDAAGAAQAPAGYFDQLPSRVLRKLPAQSTGRSIRGPLLASAASLALMAAAAGYWFGRQDRVAPVFFEAVNPPRDFQDIFADPTSFSSLEIFSQIPDLTPEETNALMTDLKKPEANVQPAKPEDD